MQSLQRCSCTHVCLRACASCERAPARPRAFTHVLVSVCAYARTSAAAKPALAGASRRRDAAVPAVTPRLGRIAAHAAPSAVAVARAARACAAAHRRASAQRGREWRAACGVARRRRRHRGSSRRVGAGQRLSARTRALFA
eukprot:630013-Pleurochrysis_carterae.AAC.1